MDDAYGATARYLDWKQKQLNLYRDNSEIEAEFAQLEKLKKLSQQIEAEKAERIKLSLQTSRLWQNK